MNNDAETVNNIPLVISGTTGTARVYTDNIEETAIRQILQLVIHPVARNSNIAVMPDVHAGAGCVIGLTMEIKDKVVPNMVGVDIGCGLYTYSLGLQYGELDLKLFDEWVHELIPAGFDIHTSPILPEWQEMMLEQLRCFKALRNIPRLVGSLGTLGGGNHFIEVGRSIKTGELVLTVHSGSRNLGLQVAKYYQNIAIKNMTSSDRDDVIAELKAQGRHSEIQETIKKLRHDVPAYNKDMAYIDGQDMKDYLHDMEIVTAWARINRSMVAMRLAYRVEEHYGVKTPRLTEDGYNFQTIHNYISVENILRKGAISAEKGEMILIPMNMRDGSLVCIGKGNPDWNYSAPHGAGRIMSRMEARRTLSIAEYEKTMDGIYSSTVTEDTIDEAPMAYKPMAEIEKHIEPTAEIIDRLVPVYNFKAMD